MNSWHFTRIRWPDRQWHTDCLAWRLAFPFRADAPRPTSQTKHRGHVPMSEPVAIADGSMLWTLEEISRLVSHNGRPAKTLDNIVELIQRRFQTDVCSVYLLEPDRANLVLAATVGLRGDSVGHVRMRLDEGLAGLVAEQVKPIMVEDATRHPRFKYFPRGGRRGLSLVPRRAARRARAAPGRARRADRRGPGLLERRSADARRPPGRSSAPS